MSNVEEDQKGAAQKRAREEEEHTDGGAGDAGPAKKAKTDEAAGAEVVDGATNGDTAAPESAADAPESAPMETAGPDGEIAKEASKPDDEPKKIGYKLFKDGKEAANYYRTLLNALTQRQNLNEYEFHMVLELLKTGHPEPEKKMGSGVMRIQVRNHETEESNCFYLIRTDGSVDDFSVFKCINRLFPAYGESRNFPDSGGPRGRGRGRGRGGRSSGRGRGRGGRRGGRRG
ncbi:hypothetical protein WJX75_005388 [Coccomyxa subellipsoidea]|uniref:Uncharacterized protein n=1 Tax=Coccomyxa subellipsoidea TaxID=248742 RepID=A0ABR2YTG7_9CHLO